MIDGHPLFQLPPGVDFAAELVRGLKERLAGQAPDQMARVTLFLNSRRMQDRVRSEFIAQGPGFLPRMLVVSDLDADPILADLPPPTSDLRRRLDLARLVGALLEGAPDLAPHTARFDLAESLRLLLAEMQDEDVTPETIAALDVSGHSAHWARTQEFLRIVAPLARNREDRASRQREAVLRLERLWRDHPPEGPVVIAGSTGSRGTTFLLMQIIARMKQGAVVVPGFDTDQPTEVWHSLQDPMTGEDHPQFRFRRLMEALDAGPGDFRPWRLVVPADAARNALVSLALRPAPVTDQWLVEGPRLPDLAKATASMTLIEAPGPREEAAALALAIRQAVQQGRKVALITPDRNLARRVSTALTRWNIQPDDPAGSPLALAPAGRFLRLAAQAMAGPMTADLLLTLLKHPLAGSQAMRGQHLAHARALELHLRRHGPAYPQAGDLAAWAGDDQARATWAKALDLVLEQMAEAPAEDLASHAQRHQALAEALARGTEPEGTGELWREAGGAAALTLMQQLQAEAGPGDRMSLPDYLRLFDTLVREALVRAPSPGHPLVSFHGHREAREMSADLVILGGLTDGSWPAPADPDPWLNRRMRRDAGLLLPERQIGLAAHDFQQAIAAGEVILSRARRDAEAETVPSRWLNRLCNLMAGLPQQGGEQALKAMRQHGEVLLSWARGLETPDAGLLADPGLQPAPRPAPRPPVAARPRQLALTRTRDLIRDPYAIYARHILNLRPLDPLRREAAGKERGSAVHRILEIFVRDRPEGESRLAALKRLFAIAETVLQEETPYPSSRLLWRARLERAGNHLLAQDARHGGTAVLLETRGEIEVEATGFTLFGTPDRIDRLPDGRLHLIDYKNGAPPSKKQQESFDKQLMLAAAMAERGAFAELGKAEVARITYIGLGAGEKVEEMDLTHEQLDDQWKRFAILVTRYQARSQGYPARSALLETDQPADYDHLARLGEWLMSERAKPADVGDADAPQ